MASEGPEPLLGACNPAVVQTIQCSRAPSTNTLYANRWKLFVSWCQARHQEPTGCPIPVILDFLQSRLDNGLAPSTIKVYITAISARHNRVDGVTVGSNTLVSRFLRGAQQLRPPQRSPRASWDLPLVLQVLCKPPFEPVELKWLSMKTAFLLAMASDKRVGELHTLSISRECLHWSPDGTGVTLWPNPSFLPKTFSASYVNQPLSLAALTPPTEDGGQTHGETLLCPVRTLRAYIEMTAGFRQSDLLFVCHTGRRRGHALSKQRLSNWNVETICYAYTSSGHPVPPRIRGHSTRGVATSWAALRGVPLSGICAATSWVSSCTYARFYRLNLRGLREVILEDPLIDGEDKAALADNESKNGEAYAELVQCLDNKSLSLVMRDAKHDGRKALEILREHYAGKDKPGVVSLYCELSSLHKASN
ncbi:hypothetical protein N1851_023293 [Merluccius polli]|uniref:Core-binding (CB) domain-containing protein n=1 Tax=Merluccius polli TaxID=89951 RepID=A0AA47NXP9_MERPO|nr:hypothetical protein N1851_023293 [Merluccius polli]